MSATDPTDLAGTAAAAVTAMGNLATEVYKDAVKPTAQAIGGEVGSLTQRTLRAALSPARGLLWTFEQAEAWVSERVEASLARRRVPDERLTPPPPYIALSVIAGVQATGSEPDLASLYAELLATAMDQSSTASAHPAFVEIIRQMTPDEAMIFRTLVARNTLPLHMYGSSRPMPSGEQGSRIEYILAAHQIAGLRNPGRVVTSQNSLERLGLVEVVPPTPIGPNVVDMWSPRVLALTRFGRLFSMACLPGVGDPLEEAVLD